jgi:hypothetical protein
MKVEPFVVIAAFLALAILPAAAIGAPPKTLLVSPAAIAPTPDGCSEPRLQHDPVGDQRRADRYDDPRLCWDLPRQLQITQAVSLVGVGAVTVQLQLPAVPANGDLPGLITISFSKLSGNAARVLNNSANYVVVQHSNS